MSDCLRKVSYGLGNVSDCLRKVPYGLGKVSDSLGRVSDGFKNVSDGLGKDQIVLGGCQIIVRRCITDSPFRPIQAYYSIFQHTIAYSSLPAFYHNL